MSDIKEQLISNQSEQFDQNMAIHTLVGNLTHWRTNMKDNKRRTKILVGRNKIFNLLDRFQVKKS